MPTILYEMEFDLQLAEKASSRGDFFPFHTHDPRKSKFV